MSYYTYILKSKIKETYYIGSCEDLVIRLERHNSGNSRSTKAWIPWEIVYLEKYENKSEVMKREYFIKRQKSKKYIENLINSSGRPDQSRFIGSTRELSSVPQAKSPVNINFTGLFI